MRKIRLLLPERTGTGLARSWFGNYVEEQCTALSPHPKNNLQNDKLMIRPAGEEYRARDTSSCNRSWASCWGTSCCSALSRL